MSRIKSIQHVATAPVTEREEKTAGRIFVSSIIGRRVALAPGAIGKEKVAG